MDQLMPGKDRDEETGKYTTSYTNEEFLEAVGELGPGAGTQAIAEEIGCDRDTAYRRLKSLYDEGYLESRKVGMTRLWRLPE
ncbi:helix-turn-helix domain-containing protein [Halosimplex sp. TS25]|uniref:helix-turn-helix domain-containing protein n=1 Tax=Halosimplex rarum TaxID=3396619 RepID=UPI0039E77371